jgi:hypothetical protein
MDCYVYIPNNFVGCIEIIGAYGFTFHTDIATAVSDPGGTDLTEVFYLQAPFNINNVFKIGADGKLDEPLECDGQLIKDPADPTAGTHVGDRDYNDARYMSIDDDLGDVIATTLYGDAGFTLQYRSGPVWGVAKSDNNARISAQFHIQYAGNYKLVIVCEVDDVTDNPTSGALSGAAVGDGEARHNTNLFNAVNMDLTHTAVGRLDQEKSAAFSVSAGDVVYMVWAKDAVEAGNLYISQMYLERQ